MAPGRERGVAAEARRPLRFWQRMLGPRYPGLEVVCVGLGRTGTNTLRAALEMLGYGPCYHSNSALFEHPLSNRLWLKRARGEPLDYDRIYGRYRSTASVTCVECWKSVVDHYPDAKVVLTVRDPDRWYDSTLATLHKGAHDWSVRLLARINPLVAAQRRLMIDHEIPYMKLGREGAGLYHRERNEAVAKAVAPERLLVYRVDEGWEPLCRFLGVAVPDLPFPHCNDTRLVQRRLRVFRAAAVLVIAGISGIVAGTAAWLLG
jgi:hypothetical protein